MKYMKECKGCVHHRALSSGHGRTGIKCCHHLLDTGERRKSVDGVCISRRTKHGKGAEQA